MSDDISEPLAEGVAAVTLADAAKDTLKPKTHGQDGQCNNCHAPLSGPYCQACGQKAGHLHKPIWDLAHDFLHSVLHWDGRIWFTLRSMLLTPAKHANDWINGRQMRYVPPIRLFVFISILLIVLLSLSDVVLWQLKKNNLSADQIAQTLAAQKRNQTCLRDSSAPNATSPQAKCRTTTTFVPSNYSGQFLSLQGKNTGLQEDLVNVQNVAVNSGGDAKQIRGLLQRLNDMMKHPQAFNTAISSSLSKYLVLAVPVHALLLKLFYIRRKRFLMEHVIVSLQSHTILYLLLLITVLLAWISRGLINGNVLISAMFIGYAGHLFVTMKRFYGQDIIRTSLKYFLIGSCYFFLMVSVGAFLVTRTMGGLAGDGPGMEIRIGN